MDEGVNQCGDLTLDDEVAGCLEVGDDLAYTSAELELNQNHMMLCFNSVQFPTDLLDKVHYFLLSRVAGDELVQVGHDVHTDVACEHIPGLGEGRGSEDEQGKTEESLVEQTEDMLDI